MNIQANKEMLLNMVNAAGSLVDEATFEVGPQSLTFRGMDPAHIALVDINHPATDFPSFEVPSVTKFGVRVVELAKVLKRLSGIVTLSISDSQELVCKSEFKEYRLRLIESSASSTPLPKLNFDAKLTLPHDELKKIFDDVQAVSEYIQLNLPQIFGRGDSGEVSIMVDGQQNTNGAKATYSLDYLSKITKAIKTDKPVTIEYSSKMPMKVTFEEGRIAYYLAPRVAN